MLCFQPKICRLDIKYHAKPKTTNDRLRLNIATPQIAIPFHINWIIMQPYQDYMKKTETSDLEKHSMEIYLPQKHTQ